VPIWICEGEGKKKKGKAVIKAGERLESFKARES